MVKLKDLKLSETKTKTKMKKIILKSRFLLLGLVLTLAVQSPVLVLAQKEGYLEASKIIFYINKERNTYNLPPLKENLLLDQAAFEKNLDMQKNHYFDHVSPSGKKWLYFILNSGYKPEIAGENLAKGFGSEREIVEAFMNSPSHRQNILNPDFKEIGVSVLQDHNLLTVYFARQQSPSIFESNLKGDFRFYLQSFLKEIIQTSLYLLSFKQ